MSNKVLVVYAAPTAYDKSNTKAMLDCFLETYKKENALDQIIEMDLNQDVNMTASVLNKENGVEFYSRSDKYINQLKSVDKLIIATPMNNFNVSTLLKNYLDYILVAKKTFRYKYDGKGVSEGLLTNLKVQILATQGASLGWYPFGLLVDYLVGVFKFTGCTVATPFLLDGTKTKEQRNLTPVERVELKKAELIELAKKF